MTERLFKVLSDDGRSTIQGHTWHLPVNGKPGRWMPAVKSDLAPCVRGYHLCRANDLIHWLGPVIYEAEANGDRVDVNEGETKIVVRRARLMRRLDTWNDRTARLFAVECAEHVLPIFESKYPSDTRPREALDVARKFANGEATSAQLAAAGAAAWDARAAAWDTGAAAGAAAWDAAGAAAWDARAAAGAAAWDAERKWQSERLTGLLGINP